LTEKTLGREKFVSFPNVSFPNVVTGLEPIVTEERYRTLLYMPLYEIYSLRNVLVQIANKMGLQQINRGRHSTPQTLLLSID
jgi:hypothetical protein